MHTVGYCLPAGPGSAALLALVGIALLAILLACCFVQTERRWLGQALDEPTRQLAIVLAHMRKGLCLFDEEGRLRLASTRFLQIWNLRAEDCPPGLPHRDLVERACPNAPEAWAAWRPDAGSEQIVQTVTGRSISVSATRVHKTGWVYTFEDVTEARLSQARLEHMALHDHLTNLSNRAQFRSRIEAELRRAAPTGGRRAVVIIDLDRFKELNDTRGHAAGDEALRIIAARLTRVSGANDCIARLGGDEFAACLRCEHEHDLTEGIAALLGVFGAPVELSSGPFSLGASMGVAIYPLDGATCDQLISNADLAMYRAKAIFGNAVCHYEQSMDETARLHRQLATDLRGALDRGEMTVKYQEQRDLRTGAISGYEALLRWTHPLHGSISPTEFIPIAEQTGDIFAIGEWVLRQACAEAVLWPGALRVAVNLSPVQLLQSALPELVAEVLWSSGLPAERLEFEVTESAIVGDKERVLHVLRQIKQLGVGVAIDDFGTGNSSLDTLHAFAFDKIKIDRSLMCAAASSPQARAIIRAVLALGRGLDLPVLAEGVETAAQLSLLNQEGCHQAQGFYFGRPEGPPSQAIVPGQAILFDEAVRRDREPDAVKVA